MPPPRRAAVADGAGHCRSALVCPFHGWVYNTDGTLRGPSRPETFGDLDTAEFGLKPIEMEVWNGFVFLRFRPGPQPAVAGLLAPFAADFAAYRRGGACPGRGHRLRLAAKLPVNWKSVRDVDNEGYHVAMAHPALQDLYGRTYADLTSTRTAVGLLCRPSATTPGGGWSVRHYLEDRPVQDWLPPRLQPAWTYYGLFPDRVILAFTPEGAQYLSGHPRRPRRDRAARPPLPPPERNARRRASRAISPAASTARPRSRIASLSIWSNESMKSDGLRRASTCPTSNTACAIITTRSDASFRLRGFDEAPPEDRIAAINEERL